MTRHEEVSGQHASSPLLSMWSQSIFFCAKRNPAQLTTLRMLAVGVLACATGDILHQEGRFGKGYAESGA
jgi:hypothetical protein